MTSQATQTATYEKSVLKNSFCKDVYNLFDIGPRFLQRYLVGSHSTKDHGALAKASDLWSDPVTENYVRFALGCIKRGRAARDIVLSSLPGDFSKRGAKPRFLDVGCAYAGFLVAFAEKDYDVCGVELNEYWASLGQANCADHNIDPGVVRIADALELTAEEMGNFDIISCNDVIEHVQDPRKLVSVLANLLAPGGTLFLEIPNRDCLKYITKDGHYNLFGTTLLGHYSAQRYFEQAKGNPNYSCGEFYELPWYLNCLEVEGLDTELIRSHSFCKFEQFHATFATAIASFEDWRQKVAPGLDPLLREEMTQAFSAYSARIFQAHSGALKSNDNSAFQRQYLSNFWSVIAVRPEKPRKQKNN